MHLATVFLILASIVCLVCALPVDAESDGIQPYEILEDRGNVLKKRFKVTTTFYQGPFASVYTTSQKAAVCTSKQKALAGQAVQKLMQFPAVVNHLELHKPSYTWPKNNCWWGKDPVGNFAVYFDVTLTDGGGNDVVKWGCTAKDPCIGEAIVTLDSKGKKLDTKAAVRGSLKDKDGKVLMSVINNHVG